MTQIRIMLDLIFDITDQTTVENLWSALKILMPKFKTIGGIDGFGLEKSTITIHRCHHDEVPPLPCEVVKKIVMGTIEQDDEI